jgi:WD40 repeat protein
VRIGRSVASLGGRRRNPGTDVPPWSAITELSRELSGENPGGLQLFEKLTGSDQLWWRCCRDASQLQPYWLLDGDHDKALEVISDTEQPRSRGVVSRAARAADLVCRALVEPTGRARPASALSDVVKQAGDCWDGSPALLIPEGSSFTREAAETSAVPHLRDQLRRVLGCLDDITGDVRQAMVAICALLLAASQPDPGRVVRVRVVFARPGEYSRKGVAGTLELREFPPGPAGLFPDPRGMRNRRGDPALDGLRLAWQFAAGAGRSSRCVLWRLSLDGGVPDYAIDGGSLGAAFAVGLRELLRRPRGSRRGTLSVPLSFFVGLRPRCAVTGVLAEQPPPVYGHKAPGGAEGPWMGKVGDMDAKIDAAKAKGLRLVAPAANRASAQPHETVHVDWAETIRQAERYARRIRPVRTAVAATALLAVIGTSAGIGAAVHFDGAANAASDKALAAHDQAVANQVINEAGQVAATNPALAAQLTLVANKTSPTPDNEARILNASASPLPGTPVMSGDDVSSMAFSPDGRTLAASDNFGNVWLWDTTDPDHLTQLGQPLSAAPKNSFYASVAFSPDGRTLAAGDDGGNITLWTSSSPEPVQLRQPPSDSTSTVTTLAFSPDGRTLATGSGDGLWLWNTTNPGHPIVLTNHLLSDAAGGVSSVAFSASGQILAAGTSEGLLLWNTSHPAAPVLVAHLMTAPQDGVTSLAFSPKGHTLAAATRSGQVWLWDVSKPNHPTQPGQPLTGPVNSFLSVAFSPDGQALAAGGDNGDVWLWDISYLYSPALLSQFPAGPGVTASSPAGYGVDAMSFSPDGRSLATYADDEGLVVWSLPPGFLNGPAETIQSMTYSPDGNNLVAYSRDDAGDGGVWLWNRSHPASISEPLKGSALWTESAGFGQDHQTLAAGTDPNGVWLWDSARPNHRVPIAQPPPDSTNGTDYSLAFSPDGRTLAAVGTNDGKVWLWQTADPGHLTKLGQASGGPLTFSPDGHTLAVGDGNGDIWLLNTSGTRAPIKLGHPPSAIPYGSISSVAFSPDGRIIAAATQDAGGKAWIWDTNRPDNPIQLGEPLTGSTVAFSPDGDTLALGGSKVWLVNTSDPARPSQLGQPLNGPAGGVAALSFSPVDHNLAVGGEDGTIQLWNLDVDDAIHRICAVTSYALTPTLWRQYISQLPYDPPCNQPTHYGLIGR